MVRDPSCRYDLTIKKDPIGNSFDSRKPRYKLVINTLYPPLHMRLYDYAYFGQDPSTWIYRSESALEDLKALAMPEDWDYRVSPKWGNPILKNYIENTFSKVHEEWKLIEVSWKYSIFNTGLVTPKYEEIFAYFKPNSGPSPWYFVWYFKKSDPNLTKVVTLPECANYFDDPAELIYDTKLELRKDIDHIIDDNRDRFSTVIPAGLESALPGLFNAAVDMSIKKVARNYKIAIPQFYRNTKSGESWIQLLLPLCLLDPAIANLALAVRRVSLGCNAYYKASTCLTLDMAINNARLITKPDDEWLRA